MLPTEDSIWVGEELERPLRPALLAVRLTATDANRFALRLARAITGRPKVLVFNWCYHGTVDETFITLGDGARGRAPGQHRAAGRSPLTTRVVELNDSTRSRALAHGDVACVLAEPALTNIGIVHPDPGYHDALREITREHGHALIIDETHTICAGPGGYTRRRAGARLLTIGKPMAGGVPAAAYGMSEEWPTRVDARSSSRTPTSAGSAGPWPATRCRSPRCGPPWRTC